MTFRSVLPHEPLPENEQSGYIHIQGAFTPRIHRSNGDDEHAELEDENAAAFWSMETLRDVLLEQLQKKFEKFGLPFAALDVCVLDPVSPFTKVRVRYGSAEIAMHVLVAWKRQKLSPSTILNELETDVYYFGSRAFQLTQVTENPLPDSDFGWRRSNPPKFRRLLARPGENLAEIEKERKATRYVFVSNLIDVSQDFPSWSWSDQHFICSAIRSVVNQYDSSGKGVEVFVSKKMSQYCHLGMRSASDARRVMGALQEKRVCWLYKDIDGSVVEIKSGKLFLDYAAITYRSEAVCKARFLGQEEQRGEPTRSTCTSTTDHVTVPGLVLVPDFVSEEEEEVLMAVLQGPHAPWAPSQKTMSKVGHVKRKVQHYGYVFDYQTADVLRDRSCHGADCPAMPAMRGRPVDLEQYMSTCVQEGRGWEVLAGLCERTRSYQFEDTFSRNNQHLTFPMLNQLTINRYEPGEGIGSHVDTPSAFSDGLISISLGSGIVMEFRKCDSDRDDSTKKLVYLPRRSLVLMSGPARFQWEHMIVTRTTDTHDGRVIPRNVRVSLTFRTAIDDSGYPLPLVESSSFPPVWGGKANQESIATPECEREHVHAVYDAIAMQWHHTRGRRGVLWPGATQFLQRLPRGSVVADVGCGDGKYFTAIWEAGSYVIGTDISRPLLMTALNSDYDAVPESRKVGEEKAYLRDRPAVAVADCMSIPLRTHSCDAAICIALLHHLSTDARRKRCIEELARIVKPGGVINVQAWAMEQNDESLRRFAANDVFVPFNAQPKYLKLEENNSHNHELEDNGEGQSMAQVYSKAFNAEYDDSKGLVVFQRYCHLYRTGELEDIVAKIPSVELLESGYESGNHFVILRANMIGI